MSGIVGSVGGVKSTSGVIPSGKIGEWVNSSGYIDNLADNTWGVISQSLSLGAGEWDMSFAAMIYSTGASSSYTNTFQATLSETSGSGTSKQPTDANHYGVTWLAGSKVDYGGHHSLTSPLFKMVLSVPDIIYLNVYRNGGGTTHVWGSMQARRVK